MSINIPEIASPHSENITCIEAVYYRKNDTYSVIATAFRENGVFKIDLPRVAGGSFPITENFFTPPTPSAFSDPSATVTPVSLRSFDNNDWFQGNVILTSKSMRHYVQYIYCDKPVQITFEVPKKYEISFVKGWNSYYLNHNLIFSTQIPDDVYWTTY